MHLIEDRDFSLRRIRVMIGGLYNVAIVDERIAEDIA